MKQISNTYLLDRQLLRLYKLGLDADELAFLQKHKESEEKWN